MNIYIFHPSKEKLYALKITNPNITLLPADFNHLTVGAIALPGNSFGIMDGGLDLVARNKYGMELQTKIQQQIYFHYNGELLVGQAIYIEQQNAPSIIYAPTMTVPMKIVDTRNVYLATLASLKTAQKHGCENIYLPLFGELTGGLPIRQVGRQMETAVEHFLSPIPLNATNWRTIYPRYLSSYGLAPTTH